MAENGHPPNAANQWLLMTWQIAAPYDSNLRLREFQLDCGGGGVIEFWDVDEKSGGDKN